MQIDCSHCKRVLEFSGEPPVFCGYCGHPLAETRAYEAETIAPSPGSTLLAARGAVPESVGGYRLVRELGQGGMGVVWEAEQAETGRRVALKLLSPHLPRTAETTERFVREGRLAAALSHPRSTFVFGAGEHDGQPYIAMELMPGRTLKDVCQEKGPLPVHRAVDYILDVIEGLEAAHACGVVHRDVKPSNCFLDSDGRVKVGDFGLSKSLVVDAGLTRTGAFMGTPQFAAPEQIRGAQVDNRTDIYAVAATLFYLIAGRTPFIGDATAMIVQIASDPAPRLRSIVPRIPKDLDSIIARSLERDPDRRYADLTQLRRALLPFATGGTSLANVGRRFAAYMIDLLALSIVMATVGGIMGGAIGAAGSGGMSPDEMGIRLARLVWSEAVWTLIWRVTYFAITESVWGCGLGKRLMKLRVVGLGGERAHIGQTLLRAVFIPGGLGVQLASQLYLQSRGTTPFTNMAAYTLAGTILPHAVELLFLTTMRAANGYRGVHELLSGTRVVRLRSAAESERLLDVPVIVPAAVQTESKAFGPFRSLGTVGQSGSVTIQLARDDMLHRAVWVHVRPRSVPPRSAQRVALSRPSRPRWLQRGETNGVGWDAFEAVLGTPLLDAARPAGWIAWQHGRFLLRDLAEELVAALDDDTLPSTLTVDQVWIDRSGQIKLLDRPVDPPESTNDHAAQYPPRTSGENLDKASPDGASIADAVSLLRAATELCTRGQVLPGHAQEFLRELAQRPATRESLAWAVAQLHDLCQRMAVIKWDDRLGIMAVTAGTEYLLYWASGLLVSMVVFQPGRIDGWTALPLVSDFLLPTILSFSTCGGVVFRFMGIELRRPSGLAASRLRCAWRSFVAWFPLIFFNAFLPHLIAMQGQSYAIGPGQPPPPWMIFLIMASCGGGCVVFLSLAGVIYGIVRPQRGIQDLLAGTCLVPR